MTNQLGPILTGKPKKNGEHRFGFYLTTWQNDHLKYSRAFWYDSEEEAERARTDWGLTVA